MTRRLLLLGILLMVSLTGPFLIVRHNATFAKGFTAETVGTQASAISTGFTFQGQLTYQSSPAQGNFEFEFRLFDASQSGEGNQIGNTVAQTLMVNAGLFSTSLDFGDIYDGTALWLEVAVRPAGDPGEYTILSPRQDITLTPFAGYSLKAPWAGISDIPSDFADSIDNDTLAGLSCGNGGIIRWNGSDWVCSVDLDTDTLAALSCANG